MRTYTYMPETEQRITAPLEGSSHGRCFWVTTPAGKKATAASGEVADYAFNIPGVREGDLAAIQEYRNRMRALVGKTITVVIRETEEELGTWRITDIE